MVDRTWKKEKMNKRKRIIFVFSFLLSVFCGADLAFDTQKGIIETSYTPLQMSLFPVKRLQLVNSDATVGGLSLGIATRTKNFYGLEAGVFTVQNKSVGINLNIVHFIGKQYGVSLGAATCVRSKNCGLTLSGLGVFERNQGVALGVVLYQRWNQGVGFSMINVCKRANSGVQIGGFNSAAGYYDVDEDKNQEKWALPKKKKDDSPKKRQKSGVIVANEVDNRMQIGIVNFANHGWQIGILNAAGKPITQYPDMDKKISIAKETKNKIQFGVGNFTNYGWQFGLLNFNYNAVIPVLPIFNYSSRVKAQLKHEKEEHPWE